MYTPSRQLHVSLPPETPMDKQDMFVEYMMANCNALMMAAREATQASEGSVLEWEVSEEDFLRSSG
jgi:hypothetical protein